MESDREGKAYSTAQSSWEGTAWGREVPACKACGTVGTASGRWVLGCSRSRLCEGCKAGKDGKTYFRLFVMLLFKLLKMDSDGLFHHSPPLLYIQII